MSAEFAAPTRKFSDPLRTADGKPRARVAFERLETLWINTGTLCNIACAHCYIESGPANDRLAYFSVDDLAPLLDEARRMGASQIGFTGGEPFMNPQMIDMARMCLAAGFAVLILTNAMRPMMRPKTGAALLELKRDFGERLALRVSLDHFTAAAHDAERGPGAFEAALTGLEWLAVEGFRVSVAGRRAMSESDGAARAGFAALFRERRLPIDVRDPLALVLFPEMDAGKETPEISTACWDIVGLEPSAVMCATSRMAVKRRGAHAPVVLACTLIPYDERFEMGATIAEAARPVSLNHPHCSRFCVLGGASCAPKPVGPA